MLKSLTVLNLLLIWLCNTAAVVQWVVWVGERFACDPQLPALCYFCMLYKKHWMTVCIVPLTIVTFICLRSFSHIHPILPDMFNISIAYYGKDVNLDKISLTITQTLADISLLLLVLKHACWLVCSEKNMSWLLHMWYLEKYHTWVLKYPGTDLQRTSHSKIPIGMSYSCLKLCIKDF